MSVLVATPGKRFNSELSSLVDKTVSVKTSTGKVYTGRLLGFDASRKDLVLGDVKDEKGEEYARVFIYSHAITEIFTKTPPLDMDELARRLERFFPKMVKYFPEARTILVMERIRVTESGVEGKGPMAEKVRKIYEEFIAEHGT